MKKSLPFAALILLACTPDIPQEARPNLVIAEFDPAAREVPVPNDLARDPATGKVVITPSATDTAAQREFNERYLGSLDGFPSESTASVHFQGALEPASVNARSVLGIDVTAAEMVPLSPRWDDVGHAIVVSAPPGGWKRAHTYAITVVTGPNGVRGAGGVPVIGSSTWALVSGELPLVTCSDLASPFCAPTIDVIPSNETDGAKRLADQTQKAVALERIRRSYAPLLEVLEMLGIPRAEVPALWTFSIVDASVMTFDPGANVVPFPNDVLRPNGKVTLPHPRTGQPLTPEDCSASSADAQIKLTCGLNTLDGFSTLAAPISETSDELGAVTQGELDPATVNARSVGLVPLRSDAPEVTRTKPQFSPCVSCVSSSDAAPQQLQWRLDAPLDERTTYLAYATRGLLDTTGKPVIASPAFALLRSTAPLVENGRSTVDVLSDEQAKRLEPLRAAMKPALDGLEAAGIPRTELVLAFAFTTQSEASALEPLLALPESIAELSSDPIFVADATQQYVAVAKARGIPTASIGTVLVGAYTTPVLVTGPGGTFDPANPRLLPVSFVMVVPPGDPPPVAGRPVTIFGHGFTRSRDDVLAIADTLARAGQVSVAVDTIFHGERTSCTGSAAATKQASDDSACADPQTQKCDGQPIAGRCVPRDDASRIACRPGPAGDAACRAEGQGLCVAADARCVGADFLRDASGRPVISGWNMLDPSSLFGTRDNFRQQVIDLAQLVRVLRSREIGTSLDTTRIAYVGQSLGGILGTLFNAVSPSTSHVVLNAAGGALPQVFLTAPRFVDQREAFLRALTAQGIEPGTPAFDRFVATAQWILDPADPANMAYRLVHPTVPLPERRALIQFIEGDETVPNLSSIALLRGANREFNPMPPTFGCTGAVSCYEFTEEGDAFDARTATPSTRHGFLLAPPEGTSGPALTAKAQTQVGGFIATRRLP